MRTLRRASPVCLLVVALGSGCGDQADDRREAGEGATQQGQESDTNRAEPRGEDRPGGSASSGPAGEVQSEPPTGQPEATDESSDAGGEDVPPSGTVTQAQLAEIRPGMSRKRVEAKLGRAPDPTFVASAIRRAEPKRTTCAYYRLGEAIHIQVCYRKGVVQTVLALPAPT